MAKLYISEYSTMGQVGGGQQMTQEPPLAEQAVAIGGGSTASAAFNAATRFVRIHTDAICSLAFGTNPTATANSRRLAANQTEYHAVPENGGYKVAVITNS